MDSILQDALLLQHVLAVLQELRVCLKFAMPLRYTTQEDTNIRIMYDNSNVYLYATNTAARLEKC